MVVKSPHHWLGNRCIEKTTYLKPWKRALTFTAAALNCQRENDYTPSRGKLVPAPKLVRHMTSLRSQSTDSAMTSGAQTVMLAVVTVGTRCSETIAV